MYKLMRTGGRTLPPLFNWSKMKDIPLSFAEKK
jgi:hypothetical protein